MWTPTQLTKIHDIIIDLKKYVPSFNQYSKPHMPYQKFPFFKNNTDGNNADSVEANYKFIPNDKCVFIHCKRTCSFHVFDTCNEMVAFLIAQKKANPELLNHHKVIHGQSYQRLRFDIDAPIEFLKHVMSDLKKPELEAKPAKPEPTGLNFIDSLEFGLYEEKLTKVRRYNDYVTKTSLNEMRNVHLMNHIKIAITAAFAKLYYGKVDILDLPANVEENLLVFDSSDKTKFSRHIIIPGIHVENHMEAKAFTNEVVNFLDEKLRPVVDLGYYKSLQNFCLFNNRKIGSPRVKVYKSGTFKAFSDLLIGYITEGSLKLPSILGQPTANAPKIDTELTKENVQAIVKLVNELAPGNSLKKVMGNMLIFTTKDAGYCPICKRDHIKDNTHFVIVHNQAVWLHCRHSETHCSKKTTLLLGHLDVTRANGLRRAMSITADEIPLRPLRSRISKAEP